MKFLMVVLAVVALALPSSAALAGSGNGNPRGGEAPFTKATEIHGAPQNNPAFDGDNCGGEREVNGSPVAVGGNCGAEDIHSIENGAPGQGGQSATDGGEPPACDMHGGLGGDTTGTPCSDN